MKHVKVATGGMGNFDFGDTGVTDSSDDNQGDTRGMFIELHRRNLRDFYPLHFFHERSVMDRNSVGSDND